ncbi:MAG TPA: TadE/TadG family type IV pilus assembly protein [Microthrixaceae bacterium]|nr:TadE/TadG family type IV pilus assembly protein [Microthrixaceae bacterium]
MSRLSRSSRRRPGPVGRGDQGGQATVELALVLPVVMIVLVLVIQLGLLARDRVLTVHAARTAARSVAVDPSGAAARAALDRLDGPGRFTMTIGGDTSPGGIATVTVTGRPSTVPIVGGLLGSIELRERFSVRVEGP